MEEDSSVLRFAKLISDRVNAEMEDGSFLERVTPTTRALLTFWFDDVFTETRTLNFHEGQRQAILNTIYVHEVLKKDSIFDVYQELAPNLLIAKDMMGIDKFAAQKYRHPKYCVKMATGTGKTWVAEALIIWQYLNAKHGEEGNYTKNFLIVAPGIIVYERWLDAFLGKQDEHGDRHFEKSDIKSCEDLFVPENYRNELYGFLQGSVASKTEIGSKVTGDGIVAVTNYHLLMEEKDSKSAVWSLPVTPGLTAGHSLNDLDASLDGKKELEYLRNLPDLFVINDEAHHIHEAIKKGEETDVEWQKSLNYISETKGNKNIQMDFSATPYAQKGNRKEYFPHIIVNFELRTAVQKGYVKTIVLDERKEFNVEPLDFKVRRDESGNVLDLSDGQRTMLRAGVQKLQNLEANFATVDKTKVPKMLVMCEDTEVVPFVKRFLIQDGMDEDDILEIHSNKKGEVGQEEWDAIRQRLFSIDNYAKPRVVISVLMLREGFDVNNICVIVPLRSSQSNILLEQTIGRGLRLMWRGDPVIDELKAKNRQLVYQQKKEADNYFDVLSIIEHPAFKDFYKGLKDIVGEDTPNGKGPEKTPKGNLIASGLKENYEEYDFRLPIIVHESIAQPKNLNIDIEKLQPFSLSLEQLKRIVPDKETWKENEATEGIHFGDYDVVKGVFRSTSYNDYLARIVNRIIDKLNTKAEKVNNYRKGHDYPSISINATQIAKVVEAYIRTKLFKMEFNPIIDDNWRVLLIEDVLNHIVIEISTQIIKFLESEEKAPTDAEVKFIPLSSVDRIMVREDYSLSPVKTIYEKLPYPSNRGGYEKRFMEFADNDGEVDAFCKIMEYKHTFARFRYIRNDGAISEYIPDFFVRYGNDVYIVETKAQDQITAENVVRKHKAAIRWIERINQLPLEKREGITWHYSILGDSEFTNMKNRGADLLDMLKYSELRNETFRSTLFD